MTQRWGGTARDRTSEPLEPVGWVSDANERLGALADKADFIAAALRWLRQAGDDPGEDERHAERPLVRSGDRLKIAPAYPRPAAPAPPAMIRRTRPDLVPHVRRPATARAPAPSRARFTVVEPNAAPDRQRLAFDLADALASARCCLARFDAAVAPVRTPARLAEHGLLDLRGASARRAVFAALLRLTRLAAADSASLAAVIETVLPPGYGPAAPADTGLEAAGMYLAQGSAIGALRRDNGRARDLAGQLFALLTRSDGSLDSAPDPVGWGE